MNILGLSEGFHDAGLCLLQNDKIVTATHAERHSGIKNDKWLHHSQFPISKKYEQWSHTITVLLIGWSLWNVQRRESLWLRFGDATTATGNAPTQISKTSKL